MSDYERRISTNPGSVTFYDHLPDLSNTLNSEADKYFQFAEQTMAKMLEISKQKNKDYTGGNSDPFANFTKVESMGICSTEQGFLTRMTDKLCRITSFVQQGSLEVKDESVEDTLIDLANYSILMLGYLNSKKAKK